MMRIRIPRVRGRSSIETDAAPRATSPRLPVPSSAIRRAIDTPTPAPAVQRKIRFAEAEPPAMHEHAAAAVQTPSAKLPFLSRIQRAFGGHDMSDVRAHSGAEAAAGAEAINARAFTRGEDVVFRGAPDLHTAAHEAAHVVQQRAGVSLPHGIGREGDAHERQADAVANAVIAGRSAEPLLETLASGRGNTGVQRVVKVMNSAPLQRAFDKLKLDPNVAAMIAEAEKGGDITIRSATGGDTRWDRKKRTIYVATARRSESSIAESLLFELANAANSHQYSNAVDTKLLAYSQKGVDLSNADFMQAGTEMEKDEFHSVVDYSGVVENLDKSTGLARNPLRRKYSGLLDKGTISYPKYVEQNSIDHTATLAEALFNQYFGKSKKTFTKPGKGWEKSARADLVEDFDPTTVTARFTKPPANLAPDDYPKQKPEKKSEKKSKKKSKKRNYDSENEDSDEDYVIEKKVKPNPDQKKKL